MRCGRGGLLLGCGSCWPCTAGSTPAAGPGDASACRARPGPARSSRPESAAVAAGVVAARLYGRGVDDRVALAAGRSEERRVGRNWISDELSVDFSEIYSGERDRTSK